MMCSAAFAAGEGGASSRPGNAGGGTAAARPVSAFKYPMQDCHPMRPFVSTLKELVVGFVTGITSMMPGVSGATMAVVFGIYERLIRDVALLRVWLRRDLAFLVTIFIGFAAGTVLAAKVLDSFAESYAAELNLFFLGLIAGQMPAIVRDAELGGGNRKSAGCW